MEFQRASLMAFLVLLPFGSMAADFSDTFLGYRYGTEFTEPANPKEITKNILQLNHISTNKIGSTYFNVDGLFSDSSDPAVNSSQGATEIYIVFREQVQYEEFAPAPASFGPVRDLALTVGFDANTKNTLFAPRKRVLVAGPTIKFDVPGVLDLSFLYYKERNHKGIPNTPTPDLAFDGTLMVNLAALFPVSMGGVQGKLQGFVNYTLAKGNDYNGNPTHPETLFRGAAMLDVGSAMAIAKNTFFVGLGYEYWRNKFGNPPSLIGTKTSTPTANLEVHF